MDHFAPDRFFWLFGGAVLRVNFVAQVDADASLSAHVLRSEWYLEGFEVRAMCFWFEVAGLDENFEEERCWNFVGHRLVGLAFHDLAVNFRQIWTVWCFNYMEIFSFDHAE